MKIAAVAAVGPRRRLGPTICQGAIFRAGRRLSVEAEWNASQSDAGGNPLIVTGCVQIHGGLAYASGKEKPVVKCTIAGCPGKYEATTVIHTVKRRGEVIVIDHVPAEVCSVCGDVLLTPETVRRIEALLSATPPPLRTVPMYDFA
jgi:YgiT-type zinc finger domain-containing protein